MQLRQIEDFTTEDFERFPTWRTASGERGADGGRNEINERTFAPWQRRITTDIVWPHSKVLVAGSFRFADGSMHPGYFQLVGTNWDDPLPPRKMIDGNTAKPLQWSARRGGGELSILSLIAPCVFVKERLLDFQLRKIQQVRETHILALYAQIAKKPSETFPVRFETHHGINAMVNSGTIPGFYRFPLDQPYEITTGEDVLSKRAKV